jgi:hypothetical protein
MRLNEFYNPDSDESSVANRDDTRKARLTLRSLGKLRRIREIKKAEEHNHMTFVSKMYSGGDDSAGMPGGGMMP